MQKRLKNKQNRVNLIKIAKRKHKITSKQKVFKLQKHHK